jgi:hypothetical protein
MPLTAQGYCTEEVRAGDESKGRSIAVVTYNAGQNEFVYFALLQPRRDCVKIVWYRFSP